MVGNMAPHQAQVDMPVNWNPQMAQPQDISSAQVQGTAYENEVMAAQ